MTKWIDAKAISSVISPWEKLKYVARKMLHSSHVGLSQWLCNTTLFVLESILCTKHTDLVKAHIMPIVTTDQRPRSPSYDSTMVIMFHQLPMNASSPNWKLAYHGHFFPFFDTLSSHGTWMQHLMLCFLTPSYEMLIYRTLQHPWVHSQSPQTFSNALRACLALGQWLQDEMWQPPHCARRFVVIHCSILGV